MKNGAEKAVVDFVMTDGEILKSYRESKFKENQIGVLADLNCCTKHAMADKLRSLGENVSLHNAPDREVERERKKFWTPERITDALACADGGMTIEEIANVFNRTKDEVKGYIKSAKRKRTLYIQNRPTACAPIPEKTDAVETSEEVAEDKEPKGLLSSVGKSSVWREMANDLISRRDSAVKELEDIGVQYSILKSRAEIVTEYLKNIEACFESVKSIYGLGNEIYTGGTV